MRKIFLSGVTLFLLFLISCSDDKIVQPDESNKNGFESAEVAQIFSDNCSTSGCHDSNNPENGLSITSHSNLMKGSSARPLNSGGLYGGDVIVPFNSKRSLLYQMISGNASVQMPFQRAALSQEEVVTIKNWIDDGAKDEFGAVPFSNPSYRVFVCNQRSDAISVIDGDEKVVSRVYETDFSELNDAPHMIKVYGNYFYVTYITAGRFVKFDKHTGEIIGQVEQLEFPGMIMINSTGSKAYVSRSSTAPGLFNSIYVIDLSSMSLSNEILLPVSGIPHAISLSPDDKILYVANLTANRISIIDTESDSFQQDVLLSQSENHEPMEIEISPDGKYLYISGRASGKLVILDTEQLTVVKEIMVGMMPMHIAISQDGSRIYVPSMMTNTVNVIAYDGNDWIRTSQITHPGFTQLHGCELSPDDNYLYVSSRNTSGSFVPAYTVNGESNHGTIGIINTQTLQVEKLLEIEEYGAGIAVD